MKRIATLHYKASSYSSCQIGDTIYSFVSDKHSNCVLQILTLGDSIRQRSTPLKSPLKNITAITRCCCALGSKILLLAFVNRKTIAYLIDPSKLDLGQLTPDVMDTWEVLNVKDKTDISSRSDYRFLVGLDSTRALYHMDYISRFQIVELHGSKLLIKNTDIVDPARTSPSTLPVLFSDGTLRTVGSCHWSSNVYVISTGGDSESCVIEAKAHIRERTWTSTALLADRFIIGFGGFSGKPLGDIYIYDSKTQRSTVLMKHNAGSDCPKPGSLAIMTIFNGQLFLISSRESHGVFAIPLTELADMARGWESADAFREAAMAASAHGGPSGTAGTASDAGIATNASDGKRLRHRLEQAQAGRQLLLDSLARVDAEIKELQRELERQCGQAQP